MASGYSGFGFLLLRDAEAHEYSYSMSASDIDEDYGIEIVLGTELPSHYFRYLDSTGQPLNNGYELKTYHFNEEPLACGFSFHKDFDNDGKKEFVLCGPSGSGGSIGVIKHSGSPGESNFNVMWWDSSAIVMTPNMGIDSGYIDGQYTILYPTVKYQGSMDFLNINTFTRNGIYSYYKSCLQVIDSTALLNARLYDIDNDNKINIISAGGITTPSANFRAFDFEQNGAIGIDPPGNEIPETYVLMQNYPNPFNPKSKIKYQISKNNKNVKILVFDIIGREITQLVNQKQNAGTYEVNFDGTNYSSGVYFYSLIIDGKTINTKKMILLR
jgi:hypothetical protein